ncbi:cyanophycinase [Limnoglobus roseus]|uniref:Cyanophycinase n=1 Tax=Limnoglobus roseus TaxID=2598579 RepID=A0A5C1AJ50_9BACT|nr:cyanophycinase [Limnoglobus roseus]QEL19479.1 cyanophycinase [Limnoglobus roseus]
MFRATVFVLFLSSSLLHAQDATPPREHLSPYGLAKPVLIVLGDLPKDFENKSDLPVLSAAKDAAPAGFQFLTKVDEQPAVGKVGLFVPADAVVQFKGRTVSNVGKGIATVRFAKSPTREAKSLEVEGRKTLDYNELRRVAAERAGGSAYPPKEPQPPVVPKGTLVIVGGAGMPAEISKRFLEAGGGEAGHFVVLPISMPDPIRTTAEESFLKKMGAKNVTAIPYREQKELEDPKVIETLKKATGIWFGGGRQWNFMDAYEGTKLPALFRDVLDRGGVIGGSSAGATIQGDYMVRGAPAGPNIMMCEGYEKALGFLPGVAIDQHFTARNRFKDMTAFMHRYPQFLGIGLDEATAIVVQGSTAEILGKGKVHFYDAKRKVKDGDPDFEAFPAGVKYDLQNRTKLKTKTP